MRLPMGFRTTLNMLSIMINQMLASTVASGRMQNNEARSLDEDFDQWWHEKMHEDVCGQTYVRVDFLEQVAKKAREDLGLTKDEVRSVLTSWFAHAVEEDPSGEFLWGDEWGFVSIKNLGGIQVLTETILNPSSN